MAMSNLLVHPGGPFWTKKDLGAWFVPKGEFSDVEEPLTAARREFLEETGIEAKEPFVSLGEVKHKSGKKVFAWAVEGNWDTSLLRSNTIAMEWPPTSGRQQEFPEVDRAEFFDLSDARRKIHEAETPFLTRLADLFGVQLDEVKTTEREPQGTLF
jgi:predicted NUDIX family NTP pyrophosphohydrolase